MPTLVFSANTGADFGTVEDDGIRSSGASGVNSGAWDPGVGSDTMLWRPTDNFNTTAIPGEITGAVFRIWQFQAFGTSSITVHENLRPWEKSGSTPSWADYSPGNSWSTAGATGAGDRSASSIGFEATPNSVDLYIEIELDAATLEAWRQAGSAPANGIQLRGPEGGFSAYRTNAGDDGERPELVITYTESGATLDAEGGSFTYTGGDASLRAGRRLAAEAGAFSYAGGEAQLRVGRRMVAEGGTFAYAGGDASLSVSNRLAAEGASYTYAGGDAALRVDRRLVAEGGAFSYSGGDADLIYEPSGAYTLVAEGGQFSFSGGDATFAYSGARLYPLAGLQQSWPLAGETQTWPLSGIGRG